MAGRKIKRTEDGLIDVSEAKVVADGGKLPSIVDRRDREQLTVCKNVSLLGGIVADVFTAPNGHSWWRDENSKMRNLPAYETPEQLVEAIERWEQKVMDKINNGEDVIPDAEAFAVGIGVTMWTINDWRRGSRGQAFKNIISFELDKIVAVKNQLAMQGKIPPLVWMAMVNARHGYATAQKKDLEVVTVSENISEKELIERARLLP